MSVAHRLARSDDAARAESLNSQRWMALPGLLTPPQCHGFRVLRSAGRHTVGIIFDAA